MRPVMNILRGLATLFVFVLTFVVSVVVGY